MGCMSCKVLYSAIDKVLNSDSMKDRVVDGFVDACKMMMKTKDRKNMCEMGGKSLGDV